MNNCASSNISDVHIQQIKNSTTKKLKMDDIVVLSNLHLEKLSILIKTQ